MPKHQLCQVHLGLRGVPFVRRGVIFVWGGGAGRGMLSKPHHVRHVVRERPPRNLIESLVGFGVLAVVFDLDQASDPRQSEA